MTRGALTASARLCVEPGAGRQRIRWSHAWPVLLRPTGNDRVHLVHGAGGPLGGDVLALYVGVAPGGALRVRSAGATVVQPGAGDAARWEVTVEVGESGWLHWAPEATVVCDGAALVSRLRVRLAPGAGAVVREVVVLGRHGERGGRHSGALSVDVGGVPLLANTTVLDGADPALSGPAGTAGGRAVGTLIVAGAAAVAQPCTDEAGEEPGVRWAWSALDGPGRVLLAVGTPARVTAVLDAHSENLAAEPVPASPIRRA